MTELPRKVGRYHVAKNIMLYVPPLGRPWFHIHVNYTREGKPQELARKLYINTTQDFTQQFEYAKLEASKMYSEVRKRAEEYAKALLTSLIQQKQEALRSIQIEQNERTEMLRNTARADVQRVRAMYGPTVNMREPFYIFQWI